MRYLIVLLVLVSFLVACAETTVVKLDGEGATPAEETQEEVQETTATKETGGAAVSTGGKTLTKCDDTDAGLTYDEIGMVTVDYSDGTSEAYYDECISFDGVVSNFLTEYFCEGNAVKSKNYQCKTSCLMIKLQANPNQKVGFCG